MLLGHAAALALASTRLSAAPLIAQRPSARVIVDNDFAGDPDGLFALAHQWLSPTARTVLVTTTALDAKLAGLAGAPAGQTAALGASMAATLAQLVGPAAASPIVPGAESFGVGAGQISPAAHAIVAEAVKDDPLPLFVACGGPLTNVAAALRLAPAIASRMTVVWIGGALGHATQPEYNFATDMAAARQVLLDSPVPVWVVPEETYRQVTVPVAELSAVLRPISGLSQWLYARYLELPPFVQLGPLITLGDSALVQAVVLARGAPLRAVAPHTVLPQQLAVASARDILVCERVDARVLMADLLAKLRLQAAKREP